MSLGTVVFFSLLLGVLSFTPARLDSRNSLTGEKFSSILERCPVMSDYVKNYNSYLADNRIMTFRADGAGIGNMFIYFDYHIKLAIKYKFAAFVDTTPYPVFDAVMSPVFFDYTLTDDILSRIEDPSMKHFPTTLRKGAMYVNNNDSLVGEIKAFLSGHVAYKMHQLRNSVESSSCMESLFFQKTRFAQFQLERLMKNRYHNPPAMVAWHLRMLQAEDVPRGYNAKAHKYILKEDDIDLICDSFYKAHSANFPHINVVYIATTSDIVKTKCPQMYGHILRFHFANSVNNNVGVATSNKDVYDYQDPYSALDSWMEMFVMNTAQGLIHTFSSFSNAVMLNNAMACQTLNIRIHDADLVFCNATLQVS